MATADNLAAAFAGESQANRKYTAFARKAEQEGHPEIAKLFRAAAEAETVHALAHFRVMKGVGDTAANVEAAIEGEGYEFREMYPEFLATAEAEEETAAVNSFRFALAVEKIHHDLYAEAGQALANGTDLPAAEIYVCPVCGNTVKGAPPEACPICSAPGANFIHVE